MVIKLSVLNAGHFKIIYIYLKTHFQLNWNSKKTK